jgi:predicted GIY-YIG superfamily endonuclease
MRHYQPVVYRLWCGDILLYIGVTVDFRRRIDEHATFKQWFRFVERFTLEPHETIAEAEAAERAAIKSEKPVFNIAHNDGWADARRRRFWKQYASDTRRAGYQPRYDKHVHLLMRRYGTTLPLGMTLEPFIESLKKGAA